MDSPEKPGYFHYAPDTGQGGGSGSTSELDNSHHLEKHNSSSKITEIHKNPFARIHFEYMELGTTGLLSALEEAEIVPRNPENPNPFDAELAEEQHEQWWEAHPDEGEVFHRAIEKQDEILRALYLGASLRRLTGGRLYPLHDAPNHVTPETLHVYLEQEYRRPAVLIEQALERFGLLAALEEAGIVPVANWPPPQWFNWHQEQRKHWKETNPSFEERITTLKYLHVGAITDRLLSTSEFKPESS